MLASRERTLFYLFLVIQMSAHLLVSGRVGGSAVLESGMSRK